MRQRSASGAFESMHVWLGEALIEAESEAFQNGKAAAVRKLEPFAKEGSREAASVVLKLDGSEYNFEAGVEDEVNCQIPGDQVVAHFHTHPVEWPHSEADWPGFLSIGSIEQSHVITPTTTYSLHKPIGWKVDPYDVCELSVLENYDELLDDEILKSKSWSPRLETAWKESVFHQMAAHYGIIVRIGKRGV